MNSAISLFSGCGGFCEGIELGGFEIRQAVEWDKYAAATYRFNFPKTPLFEGDIANFLPDGLTGNEKRRLSGTDLVFGGPPCQGFSQIGKRQPNDERNSLFKEFGRIVSTVSPKIFLMENVPNLALLNGGYFKDLILSYFATIGYSNTVPVEVWASDFGVPQERKRLVFVGVRDDLTVGSDLHDYANRELHSLKSKSTVSSGEALSDLPNEVVPSGHTTIYPFLNNPTSFQKEMRLDCSGKIYSKNTRFHRGVQSPKEVLLHNHHTKDVQQKRKAIISMLEPGMKADSLPKEMWNGKRPEKWRRLHFDRPSHTILAHMHRDLSEWIHPVYDRWITVREAARLQSFHDGFVFQSSEWQQLKQIGNAVPPLLGHKLALFAQQLLADLAPRRQKLQRSFKYALFD